MGKKAIRFAKKEVSCLEHLPKSEANRRRILDARTALANYCLNLNYHSEAKEAILPILEWAQEGNDAKSLSTIYTILGSHCLSVEEEQAKGRQYIEEALRLAEEGKDYFSFWNACYVLGCFLSWNCEFEKARDYDPRGCTALSAEELPLLKDVFDGPATPAGSIAG